MISNILKKASERVVWKESSSNWETGIITSQSKHILIGILYLSKNGSWYVADKSCQVSIILTRSCSSCSSFKQLFCTYNDLNLSYLIALQNFDIVFEKIKFKNGSYCNYKYLRTSCCYLFYIGTYFKENNFYISYLQENISYQETKKYSVTEIADKLEETHISNNEVFNNSSTSSPLFINSNVFDDSIANIHFLVLNKIWTIVNNVFICKHILVLTLPKAKESLTNSFNSNENFIDYCEKKHDNNNDSKRKHYNNDDSEKNYNNNDDSFYNESSNFYETDDDLEFAQLVDSMENLFLEDRPKLIKLHFESGKQCSTLMPCHIYKMDVSCYALNQISSQHYLMKIKPTTKITHSDQCLGNYEAADFESEIFCSVKEIILRKKVRDYGIIRAVLVDKLYEEDFIHNCSQSEINTNMTFCLVVKDLISEDRIKVYLRYCPKNMFGLLPGLILQLYGFTSICSKKGHLYLTPLSSFSIQVENSNYKVSDGNLMGRNMNEECKEEQLKLMHLRNIPFHFFKCLCYIIKIESAKFDLICNSCMKSVTETCFCFCNYRMKLTVSFLIDDGTNQVLTYCEDETARKILMLSEKEWCKIVSCITESKQNLTFSQKMSSENLNSLCILNKIFYTYCSSKTLSRQVLLKCKNIKNFDRVKLVGASICCCDVLETSAFELIPELILQYEHLQKDK